MKLDRLIAILSVLLNREQITAPELAKRFEVSRRSFRAAEPGTDHRAGAGEAF